MKQTTVVEKLPDVLKERYSRTATETDVLGRTIEVRPLRPSESIAIMAWADCEVQRPGDIMSAGASVRKINATEYDFPDYRRQLNAMIDLLGEEGLEAAVKARAALSGAKPSDVAEPKVEAVQGAEMPTQVAAPLDTAAGPEVALSSEPGSSAVAAGAAM